MKKVMFLLAFVSFGIFANASNEKIAKINFPVKKVLVVKLKKSQVARWMWYYSCGGKMFTGCCYDTTAQATAAGNASIASNSACN